ncbi:MAG: FtsX-like permease family protein [Bacteroidales bacterium]|nr:MAG: FtsX-like permease family protein [Bacteroidales bacterium]
MIRFLFKGLLRDRQRSLLPSIVVAAGVMLTVFLVCYLTGIMGGFADFTSKFSSGHVKIMTRAYADNMNQKPIDLALTDVSEIIEKVRQDHPDMDWVLRTQFGGLLDVPDENGETRSQGPSMAIAIDMLTPGSKEPGRLTLDNILVKGSIPDSPGEILISDEFATKLEVVPGDAVTLMGSTMYGSMSFYNFTISGTIRFGVSVMDRGAIIVDFSDAQAALDMQDASGEILGYLPSGNYNGEEAGVVCASFNSKYTDPEDEFSPVMLKLSEQDEFLGGYLEMIDAVALIVVFVFILAMSIVLWNTGLIGGLRRYGEVGVRLAVGEGKGHIYKSMIYESAMIGIIGSALGTIIGLLFAYWVQEKGIDISSIMKGATMMMPGKFHAKIVPEAYYLGFIPGLFSTTLGTMLSGIGIYKRKTAQLFKELET